MIWLKIFLRILMSGFSKYYMCWRSNCGRDSQFGISSYDEIWSEFLSYFNRFYFFMLFCITVLFQDNPKLVEARFVWRVVAGHLSGFPLRVVPELFRLCFFLRSVHTFSWFLKSNWSSDFGHAETGSGAKKRVVLRREIFCSKFKVEWENGVWTKIRFLASGFLFTCGNFTFIFTVYSIFWIGFFF